MTLDEILDILSDIEIVIAGAGAIVFAFSYATFFNWRKTDAGRALMYFVLSLIALVVRSFVGRWFGADNWWWLPLTFAVYFAISATIWRLVWVLWKNWRKGSPRPLELELKTPRENKDN